MPRQMLNCTYCGVANPVPITPSSLDYEGNNPSTRLNRQRHANKVLKFTCKVCKKENIIKR